MSISDTRTTEDTLATGALGSRARRRLVVALLVIIAVPVLLIVDSFYSVRDRGNRDTAETMTVRGALGLYRERHGVFPTDFRDIESICNEMVVGVVCEVSRQDIDHFAVRLKSNDAEREVRVRYVPRDDGTFETFHIE